MNADPNRRYTLLVLTSQLPYPPHQGATIRSYNVIRELSRRADIDLLSFTTPADRLDAGSPLWQLCRRVETVPAPVRPNWKRARDTFTSLRPDMALRYKSRPFGALLERYLQENRYDAILFIAIDMGPYLEQVAVLRNALPAGAPQPRLIFDDLNAEYLLQQRAFETDLREIRDPRRWAGALYSFIQCQKLRRFEARLCRLADDVVAVSEADRLALARIVPHLNAALVPNGVDLEHYRPGTDSWPTLLKEPSLVFTGKMDFRPNVDAACWFADEVLPLIQAALPAVTFAIVGRDPHPRVRELASRPGILVTGYVEDDLPYFEQGTIYVAPLRVGGGTRLKLLTAMAMEKAIVSTSLGCEGLGAQHGVQLIIADSAAEFAAETVALVQDEARRQELGWQGRRFVEERYGWPALAPRLEILYAR